MLPRSQRLSKDTDVLRVLKKGRAVFTNLLSVKAIPNPEARTRITVVVSTKVHKRATKRNVIKRRVREAFRKLVPMLKTPVDIVVTAKEEAVDREYDAIFAALEYSLKKMGLL